MKTIISRLKYVNKNNLPYFSVKYVNGDVEDENVDSSHDDFDLAKSYIRLTRFTLLIAFILLFGLYLGFALSFPSETFDIYVHKSVLLSSYGPVTVNVVNISTYNYWIIGIVIASMTILSQIYPLLADMMGSTKKSAMMSINCCDLTDDESEMMPINNKNDVEEDGTIPNANGVDSKVVYVGGYSNEDYYVSMLLWGVSPYSWIERAITSSTFIWMIGQLAGVRSLTILIILVIMVIVCALAGGYNFELASSSTTYYARMRDYNQADDEQKKTMLKKPFNLIIYFLGMCLPSILLWGLIITYFSVQCAHGQPSWLAYTSVIVSFLFNIIYDVFLIPLKNLILNGILEMKPNNERITQNYCYESRIIWHNFSYEFAKILLEYIPLIVFITSLIIYTKHK